MGYLAEQMRTMDHHLNERLQVENLFEIPVKNPIPSITLDGGSNPENIFFAESTVVSWIVMGVLIVLAIIITSGFRIRGLSKRQIRAEGWHGMFYGMAKNMLNHEAQGYAPYMCTVLYFIGLCNIFGIFGFKPPTKDLNVTAALALMTIVLVQAATIRAKGIGGWGGGFKQNPMNVLELFTRPLSLCMRLFGNVLGAFVIMQLIEHIIPVVLPGFVSLYFDIFDGLLQAYVFTFLSSLFISEAVE